MKVSLKRFALMGLPAVIAVTAVACGSAQGNAEPTIPPDLYAPIPTPRPFGRIPTPTSTPFVLPFPTATQPAPTATSTNVPTATATAEPSPTQPAPTVTGAPGDPPGGETATPSPTSVPQPTASPTPQMSPTPFVPTPTPFVPATFTPAPTSTPVPLAQGGLVYMSESGVVLHDPDHFPPDEFNPDVYETDFSVSVTFRNPFHSTFRPYSYGVKFRDDGTNYHMLAINSEGEILYYAGTPDSLNVARSFPFAGVETASGAENSIQLTVVDNRAWLFVNGTFLAEFQVGGQNVYSDVALVAEVKNESLISLW